MTCDFIQLHMKAFLDDELSRWTAWRIRRHLAHCPDCAAELASLEQFHVLLRSADWVMPNADFSFPRRTVSIWKLAGGALATTLLIVLLVLLPTLRPSPRSLSAAAVAAALSHVNTWHFSGWKQINGQRVTWDVWGRRAPFLFYERVGNDITFDNGKQRLRIFPPHSTLNRPVGMVIRLASDGATLVESGNSGWSLNGLVNQWNWQVGDNGMTLARQTATEEVFRQQYPAGVQGGVNCNQLFTIDRATMLPIRYQLRYNSRLSQRDTEQLRAEYDVSLPTFVTNPFRPASYQRVDLTAPSASTLAVQSHVLALDSAGNVLVQYQCRMGGLLLSTNSTFSVSLPSVDVAGIRQKTRLPYIASTDAGLSYPDANGSVFSFYSPLQPLIHRRDLPTQLRIALSVFPQIAVEQSDLLTLKNGKVLSGPQAWDIQPRQSGQTLFTTTVTQTLALPSKPNTSSVALAAPKELDSVFSDVPLEASVDLSRADFYLIQAQSPNLYSFYSKVAPDLTRKGIVRKDGTFDLSNVKNEQRLMTRIGVLQKRYAQELQDAKQKQLVQAAYWTAQWLNGMSRRPGDPLWIANTFVLAMRYRDAGEEAQSRQTLRRLMKIYEQQPGAYGLELRQARYALQTQSFPDDPGYKGPTS